MRKLPIIYSRFSEYSGEITRNYHSLKIEHSHENFDFTKFEAICSNIQSLEISHSTFKNNDNIKTTFGCLKLLNNVKLVQVKADCEIGDEPQKFSLTLKKLEWIQTDHRLLNALSHVQVLNFAIIDANNRTNTESLVKFLALQNKLNSLALENLVEGSSGLFDKDESKHFKFKLKTLSTLFSRIPDVESFELNFISFLKLQADTLRSLKVEGSLPCRILKYMIAELINIEELEVSLNELPLENSFYDSLKPNLNLKTLKLNGTITRANLFAFKGILSHYQNIEFISLADTDQFVANDVFNLMSNKLRKLNHLSVLNFHQSFKSNAVFPSLKYFSIRILNEIDQWKDFINSNKSIRSLNVGWVKRDQFTTQIISEITDLPNLRYLKFGGRFIAGKRIYDVIKCNYKNLEVLELMVANYEEIKNLKFIFPRDKSLWRPQCDYFDEFFDREPLND